MYSFNLVAVGNLSKDPELTVKGDVTIHEVLLGGQ